MATATINSNSGVITGQSADGTNYTTNGPVPVIAADIRTLRTTHAVTVNFASPNSLLSLILPYLIWILIFGGFMYYLTRQARGQMNGMMSSVDPRPNSSIRTGLRRLSRTSRVTWV